MLEDQPKILLIRLELEAHRRHVRDADRAIHVAPVRHLHERDIGHFVQASETVQLAGLEPGLRHELPFGVVGLGVVRQQRLRIAALRAALP
jgi:hypothetical protein